MRLIIIYISLFLSLTAFAQHSVLILDDDVMAMQARIDLILKAKKSIRAQYFIFGDDAASLTGLTLIRDKARQHVKVKLLIDAFFNAIPYPVMAHLIHEGVEIKVYHPFRFTKLNWLWTRMHDKGMSIDGKEMIRGGRNVENSYFGHSNTRNFIDRDVYVMGPSVKDSDIYFDELFNSKEVGPINVQWVHPAAYEEGERILDEALKAAQVDVPQLRFKKPEDWSQKAVEVKGSIRFLHDPVGQKSEGNGIAQRLRDILNSAKNFVLIESPYLVPTKEFLRHARAAIARGVIIVIHTNSAESTDGLLPQAGYIREKQKLLDLGIHIFEYKGPDCLHAKSAVIDGQTAIISSYNLDPRSQFLNTEIGIVIQDQTVAGELTESIFKNIENSYEIGPNGLPLMGEDPLSRLSVGKRALIKIIKLLYPFLKKQL